MSYPIDYPTPQNANVQIFNAVYQNNSDYTQVWIKPQGASFVWFTLIGAGASGDASFGGGSGCVTNFMCPAFLIPDVLNIQVGQSVSVGQAGSTSVFYSTKNLQVNLLIAYGGAQGGGTSVAMSPNFFTAMGFFQAIDGQIGTSASNIASPTTFLSGGSGGAAGAVTANYGYSSNASGFFQAQPIICGVGGSTNVSTNSKGGIGCGGSYLSGTVNGGPGMAVIITW